MTSDRNLYVKNLNKLPRVSQPYLINCFRYKVVVITKNVVEGVVLKLR